jgi:hypothetical protein
MIYKLFFILMVFLNAATSYAAINPASLIKVNKDNNPKCVEYYTYKNTLYCSETSQSETIPDVQIKDRETQKIKFDERPWQAVWSKQTAEITTLEYVPAGDDINQWHELVTSQFIPMPVVSVKEYVDGVIKNLQDSGFKPEINIIEANTNQIIFEFKIKEPKNLQQDELQIVRKNNKGLYIVHYVIKNADMGETNRKKWILNLKESKIIP